MREDEAKAKITEQISVTRQMVTIAKSKLLELFANHSDTSRVISMLLENLEAQMPEKIVLNPAVDPLPNIAQAAKAVSWQAAASEAIWELMHDNHIIPTGLNLPGGSININWTTIYEHSGGYSSSWTFDNYRISVPTAFILPPSRKSSSEFLVNSDLYLHDLGIPNLHPDIDLALREAVRCFRYDLFTASATMLGKASEGAWLELGAALIDALPPDNTGSVRRQKDDLENPAIGIGKKIEIIVTLYERQDLYSVIAERSGVSIRELRTAASWSDTVRDSRNTIHFGVESSVPNTYEKVAALLLGVVPYLRMIYQVKAACESRESA
jgi:hypothetical protein